MQAMNGYGASGTRRSARLVGCLIALVVLSAMTVPSIASAKETQKVSYIGLGDSLAFGYSQQLFNEYEKLGEPASAFENGYVNDYFAKVNKGGKVKLDNLGCPGETTESLIGTKLVGALNAALAGKIPEPVTGEAPCAYHYGAGLPLHHEYGGTKSQLESALETIAAEKAAGKPVKMISLNIGANDQLHAIAKIKAEVTAQITAKVTAIAKTESEEAITKKLEKLAAEHVTAIVTGIANKEVEEKVAQIAHEEVVEKIGKGELPYEEPADKEAGELFAYEYAVAHHAELVKEGEKLGYEYSIAHKAELEGLGLVYEGEYGAIHHAELAAEGQALGELFGYEYSINHKAELEALGNALFAQTLTATAPGLFEQINVNITGILTAIRGAGYTKKIIFQGGYNPYGNYGAGELLPGSNTLLAALNAAEKVTVHKKPFKACFTDPQTVFNPGLPAEAGLLATLTNMANGTKFEGKANGPDIHPTPAGYEALANQMASTCRF
jgi:lysophospholipase L1-like esterase